MNTVPDYVKIVTNPFQVQDDANRKGLLVGGAWVPEIVDFIQTNQIKALYLNYAKGWVGNDFSFLSHVKGIEELSITVSKAEGLDAIESMKSLVELKISGSTHDHVDFSKLTKLQRCFLSWWKGADSIFDCTALKTLYIDCYKAKNLDSLRGLKELRKLTIGNSPIQDITGLYELSKLEELHLLNCRKLSSFDVIGSLGELKRLYINGSKRLEGLNFLAGLKHLEVLSVCDNGKMASLAPLVELKALKAVAFSGRDTLIEDGDLSVFESLPKLSMLMFQGRRHYSHKLVKKWNWDNFNQPDTLLEKR